MDIVTRRAFPESISPFLLGKLEELKRRHGAGSWEYLSLARQYFHHSVESRDREDATFRHYDADLYTAHSGEEAFKGVERLYRRTILMELTTACVANCRWCLRANYQRFALKSHQISHNVRFFGSAPLRDEISEILITGGDPLTSIQRLEYTLDEIERHAPNIRIIRIGSRAFTQNPGLIHDDVVRVFLKHRNHFRIEFGTMINSPVEFWPESMDAIHRLQDIGIRFYLQHPLLKGVNDQLDILVSLYDQVRVHGIEPHYLFHCVPMSGQHHHRTSVDKGVRLIRQLTSGGHFSGRAKPRYTLMTGIGKIVLWDGVILDRDTARQRILLQSEYRLQDRLRYNPVYKLPEFSEVDAQGLLRVWYPDGEDDDFWEQPANRLV
ncbi:MAG: radical SAM protein [Magnetococcales bacterium]|nr:radical SAM protein [Magnetococcales bacterium]